MQTFVKPPYQERTVELLNRRSEKPDRLALVIYHASEHGLLPCRARNSVTIQEGAPGDGRSLAGARGALRNIPLVSKAAQAAREGDLNRYY
ncbi:MAG TPA: hypothetical protein VFN35_00365 [Ktedonobacteraceae bacterium]|nr:hypothetical protein [Ktedonobacteraceae bacterium]